MEDVKRQCWINEAEAILSFHPVIDYILHEFNSQEEMLQFVFRVVNDRHFRVQ